MGQINVRPYEERDREGFFRVRSVTYEDARPIPLEKQVFKTTTGYVAEVGGEIAGVFSVLDLSATRGPALLRNAGLSAVAVLPHHRRAVVGSEMMKWALAGLRTEGFDLASLYAYRENYYRRFGYEVCGQRWKIDVPNHRYPAVRASLPIRALKPSDVDVFEPVYEAFAHARSGLNIRTPLFWERVLGTDDDSIIYVAGDPAQAYAIVRPKGIFWQQQTVAEFVWSSVAGYESVLSTFAGLGINKASVSWWEPGDGLFLGGYMDQGVTVSIDRPIMFRALDVRSLLSKLQPLGRGEFSLRVLDEFLPENEGPWRVAFGPDGVVVEPTSEADLTLDIRRFTQAALGEPSLGTLVRSGLVQVGREAAVEIAGRLLSPIPVYCSEFF